MTSFSQLEGLRKELMWVEREVLRSTVPWTVPLVADDYTFQHNPDGGMQDQTGQCNVLLPCPDGASRTPHALGENVGWHVYVAPNGSRFAVRCPDTPQQVYDPMLGGGAFRQTNRALLEDAEITDAEIVSGPDAVTQSPGSKLTDN